MRDLYEVKSEIRDDQSRKYFEEAEKAYYAGAYRSSLMAIWTAVVLDLIKKIQVMANSGDSDASELVTELSQAIHDNDIPNQLSIEREIIKKAKKLELLNSREETELERLRNDRHMCAHPAIIGDGNIGNSDIFSPSEEMTRAYLVSAVSCCLSLPPVPGKDIEKQFQKDLASESWPSRDQLKEFLDSKYLSRTRTLVKKKIIKQFIKFSVRPPEKGTLEEDGVQITDPLVISQRCRQSINIIADGNLELLEESFGEWFSQSSNGSLKVTEYLPLLGTFGCFSFFEKKVDKSFRIQIMTLLRPQDGKSLPKEAWQAFLNGKPRQPDLLEVYEEALERICSNEDELSKIVRFSVSGQKDFVSRALKLLERSGSYRSAENNLQNILKLSDYLEPDDIQLIVSYIKDNNQIYGASQIPATLWNIFEKTHLKTGMNEAWKSFCDQLKGKDSINHSPNPEYDPSYKDFVERVLETLSSNLTESD